MWITNAPIADVFVVCQAADDSRLHPAVMKGLTAR
jgi:alkylation response protein AidB-like acyl-CoA dehydrogenase